MENTTILAMIFFFLLGGPAGWGVVHTILEHRKEMAKLQHQHEADNRLLTNEKDELKETISHMQDRLAVLETIATDPARRTAEQIEDLR